MYLSAVAALLLACALFVLIRRLRGSALLPVRPGRNQTLTVTIRSEGDDPSLESTVNALLWLRENGTLPAGLVIEDGGMSAETRLSARLLEKKYDCVQTLSKMEDDAWETSRNI